MRRPRLPRIRGSRTDSSQQPAAPAEKRGRRLRPRLPRRRARAPGPPRVRRPLGERAPLRALAAVPLPAALRTPTSLLLMAVVLVLLIVIVVGQIRSPGEVSISAAGAGSAPLVAGFPLLGTSNTTRIAARDPLAESAAVAVSAYPGGEERTKTVAVADANDWHAALVASVLMSPPLGAPLVLSDGSSLGAAGSAALERLAPSTVIRVGSTASPSARHTINVTGANPAALAANVAAYVANARGAADNRVMVVNVDAPAFAMAAAGWAAKSGDPILFVTRDAVPPETRDAIERLQQPRIYIVGPGTMVGLAAVRALRKLGRVHRIAGPDPIQTAAAFARYKDGDFGWGPIQAGRGVVIANDQQPVAAAAAAALSASGTYGALLVLANSGGPLPTPVAQYLLDTQPGYASDPAHGVYNHAWLVGDGSLISVATQASIDKLLEIVPVH